jgi:TonB family protein
MSFYRDYDWGPDDIPPEALTRPTTAAVLMKTGYVRKLPNGKIDPCDLLVCDSDYPPGARRRGVEAEIVYHVLVTAQGQPKSCRISMPTSAEDLNKATCAVVMARARFTPARDSSGADRSSVYSGIMRWTLK